MPDLLFEALIPLEKHKTKKNSRPIFKNRKTGKFFLGKDADLVKKEEELITKLKELWGDKPPIQQDIHVQLIYFFKFNKFYTKKGCRAKRIGDLDNLPQMPLDCLQKANIIKDDQQVCSLDGLRRFPREQTMLDIKIWSFQG